eukprot:CAMPEP_0171293572 /NCGR_PEP_ID=MMETSP0816-20121228/1874_1 /TAXON_ID=420281 /ORGANISM="Proboscia inermis, Strain CCAP1064/1" /LENGTH=73 /DNA_ID=CAMNT_0011764585 /DNA_START=425 /DNA_END=646 /DNA_ORIENTATION=+
MGELAAAAAEHAFLISQLRSSTEVEILLGNVLVQEVCADSLDDNTGVSQHFQTHVEVDPERKTTLNWEDKMVV